jgi:hypothetical protein
VPHSRTCICILCIVGVAAGQESAPSRAAGEGLVPSSHSSVNRMNVNPVVLNRAALEEKVITLRLVPKMATSIRMLEPVNSVVLGDPENFLAEHSEHEPEMVTVKPVNSEAAQTNLLITTTRGHQANLLLVSNGENGGVEQPVDVFLKFGRPSATSFLVEEDPQPSSFIAETRNITAELKRPETLSSSGTAGESGNLIRTASLESAKPMEEASSATLDKLLERQKHAPLPELYGQEPGEIEAGQRVKAGVSEVLDQGREVVVLFSVKNPANHAIEIMPPQIQLGGKIKKKWTTAEQLTVTDFRLSTRRLGPGQRADGVAIFERPSFKQSSETLFLQVADSGAVDKPALAPIGFGISSFRGGSAYGTGRNGSPE